MKNRNQLKSWRIFEKKQAHYFKGLFGIRFGDLNHHWELCEICGPMVVCGVCGNNCCNGGSGLPLCSCEDAYRAQRAGFKAVQKLKSKKNKYYRPPAIS